jgi:hypothetical protein
VRKKKNNLRKRTCRIMGELLVLKLAHSTRREQIVSLRLREDSMPVAMTKISTKPRLIKDEAEKESPEA